MVTKNRLIISTTRRVTKRQPKETKSLACSEESAELGVAQLTLLPRSASSIAAQ